MRAGARAVILSPSRELALQTHKVVKELGRYTDLRTAVLVGGDSMEAQARVPRTRGFCDHGLRSSINGTCGK